MSPTCVQAEEEEKKNSSTLRWSGGEEVGLQGGECKPTPEGSHLQPLVEGARSLTYCMVLNPPLHSRSPWMTLHLVAFGLFTLSGRFPRELGSPLEPSI